MADEYDYYGRKKNRGLTAFTGTNTRKTSTMPGTISRMPDYPGVPNRTAPNAPKAGRTNTFSRQLGTGMKAVGDTNEAIANPDNAPSTRLFQAGNHQAVSSSIQDDHDPAMQPPPASFRARTTTWPEKPSKGNTVSTINPRRRFSGQYVETGNRCPV